MCLYAGNNKMCIADKSITCYKVMIKYQNCPNLYSYVYGYSYLSGKAYSEPQFRERTSEFVRYGFHSYQKQNTARLLSNNSSVLVIVKCEIPKGARYYISASTEAAEYCSDKIRIIGWKRYNEKTFHK